LIVVFGSINLDLVARVARLPRPGETRAGTSFATSPGGKGANQALAARRAGARVAMFGAVGRDAFAAPALALLDAAGVDLAGVQRADAATGVALIHVDDAGENAITVVPGANARARAADVPDAALAPGTTLVLQLETPHDESLALARRARARGARVVLNPAPAAALPAPWFDAVDVLVANETEAGEIAGPLGLPAAPCEFAAALSERHRLMAVATLGSEGAFAAAEGTGYRLPALEVDARDTVGAGDAFVGVLAAALDRGDAIDAALALATAAGSIACTRPGAQAALPGADEAARAAAGLLRSLSSTTLRNHR
jgi:ribokinase